MPAPVEILRGVATGGKVNWDPNHYAKYQRILAALEDQRIELTVRKERKRRSLLENSYYWAVPIKMLAEAAGCSEEEMHDALRMEFLRVYRTDKLPTIRSTTDLSTVEFEEYMRKIRQLGAEMYGIYIPDPGEII